jgi:hypothetical protein
MANDAIGAYDDVSPLGQSFSKWLIPFWRFDETNIRGYFRQITNTWFKDPDVVIEVGRSYADRFKATTKLGASAAWRIGKLAIKLSIVPMLAFVLNRIIWPDEDDDVPEWAREQPHMTLGKINGKTYYLSDTSTFLNALGWIGFDDVYGDIADIITGKFSLADKVKEIAGVAEDKMLDKALPIFQTLLELKLGKDFYTGSTIHDQWQHVFESVQMGWAYDTLFGLPKTPTDIGLPFNMTPVKSYTENESSYWGTYDLVDEYIRSIGRAPGSSGEKSDKSMALMYFRNAIRYKDNDAALRWLKEYVVLGGTKAGLETSVRNLNPLHSLNVSDKEKFIASLSGSDLTTYQKGMAFYNRFKTDLLAFAAASDVSIPK